MLLTSLMLTAAWQTHGTGEANEFAELLKSHVETKGAVGGVLYILQDGETDQSQVLAAEAVGMANLGTERPADPGDLFRYASISKTYIALLVVRAHLEGKLQLDDPLTGRFPGGEPYLPVGILDLVPHASKATLHSLLTHSCSVYDYRDEAFTAQLIANPFRPLVEADELQAGLQRGLANGSAPSDCQVGYSNSNYVLLGMTLDRLYGHHHSVELHRVLEEMGLQDTYYEKHYQLDHYPDLERLSHSYVALPGRPDLIDATWADDGYGFANGGLIGTPRDLARFYSILFSDRHAAPMKNLEAKKRLLDLMAVPNEMGLALGSMVQDGYHWHGGSIGGFSALASYSPERRTAIVFYTNDGLRFPSVRFELMEAVKAKLAEPTAVQRR